MSDQAKTAAAIAAYKTAISGLRLQKARDMIEKSDLCLAQKRELLVHADKNNY